MKKLLSIILVIALVLSMSILPSGITASAETKLPENAFYDFTSADSTAFEMGKASTDALGNEFYAFNYCQGNIEAHAKYELTEIQVGSKNVSGLKIQGYKDPTNSNIWADGIQIIPTDENGQPFITEPNAKYKVEIKWYYNFLPAHLNYYIGAGALATKQKDGTDNVIVYGKDSKCFDYGDYQPAYGGKVYTFDGNVTQADGTITKGSQKSLNTPLYSAINFWAGSNDSSEFTDYTAANCKTTTYILNTPDYETDEYGRILAKADNTQNGGTDTYSLTYDPYLNITFSGLRGRAPSGEQATIIIDYISIQKDVPSDGKLRIYNGNELYKTIEGLNVGDNIPAFDFPEAPEGKYFAGLSLDPAGNRILTSATLESGVNNLYCIFKDYYDTYTDSLFAEIGGKAIYPLNYDGKFYPTFNHKGWGAKGVTDGTFRFYAYNTWSEGGLTFATDDEGYAVVLKPYSKYTMTVTYRSQTMGKQVLFKLGYGLTPNLVTDLSNKGFTFNAEEILVNEVNTEWQTTSFEFETGSLNGIVPFAGIFANSSGLTDGVRSEIQIKSIQLEKADIEYGVSYMEYNGGFKDYDMSESPIGEQYIIGEEPKLPETAYRYRYAFDGWFYDEEFTQPAGERYENGKTYYAKWVLYGDLDEDGLRNAGDLAVMKKHISGIEECDSVGAEVTDDNAINAADLAALKKKIAGLNSILGPTRYIALTFDDGPSVYFTNIVNSFNKYNGKATFFLITDSLHLNAETKPHLQYAIDQGFEIGNHSMNHPNMQTYTDKEAVKSQMQNAWQRVYNEVGYDMKIARLPNFGINDVVKEAMIEMKLPMFGNAFTTGEGTDKVVSNIVNNAYDGAIVCLHAIEHTANMLDELLAELHENGYVFVSGSELFEIKGYDSIPLGVQHKCAKPYKKLIALTFDDGPNASMLPIVDSFKKYNGACTFFLIGQNINAGQTAYLNHALDNGCQLASHTFKHDGSLINSTSKEEVLAEFENTNIALNNVVGVKTTMARLPGLGGNELIYETCKEAGIPLIAGFGVTDWSGTTTTAQDVANTVIKNATDGSIFVMHSTPKTAEALEIILPELEKQGYDFVTVEELFEGKGYSSIPLGYQLNSAQQQY